MVHEYNECKMSDSLTPHTLTFATANHPSHILGFYMKSDTQANNRYRNQAKLMSKVTNSYNDW